MAQDRIYALPLNEVGNFTFDEQVVEVFPDMIQRSVPGYGSILAMTAELAEYYAIPGSNVYDLGCSLGAATLAMRDKIPSSCCIHAVDSSPAMITELRKRIADHPFQRQISLRETDLESVAIVNASFVVLNFTLQFIAPERRAACLSAVFEGMVPGGGLVLSEKICFEDPGQQSLMTDLHHAFKRAHGYSELEIAQKRTALEKTLIAETAQTHTDRLRGVGFAHVAMWFQCFNFVSMLAVK